MLVLRRSDLNDLSVDRGASTTSRTSMMTMTTDMTISTIIMDVAEAVGAGEHPGRRYAVGIR